MADYYSSVTMAPFIKKELITKKEIDLLGRFGFEIEEVRDEDSYYFYAAEYNSETAKEEGEDDVLIPCLVKIIKKSKGKIPYIYLQGAQTCSKLAPDSHGGFACLVTEEGAEWMSTYGWLEEKIEYTFGRDKSRRDIVKSKTG